MSNRSAHPNEELFDHLSGRLDEHAGEAVEAHLLDCAECRTLAQLLQSIKGESLSAETEASAQHPDVAKLADFFYNASEDARDAAVAAHLAECRKCASELAEYARAESAASHYELPEAAREAARVPQAAWEMIRDWEESAFARPRSESQMVGEELLAKLARLLSEKRDEMRRMADEIIALSTEQAQRPDLVPVVVIDRSGEFRGVEMFTRTYDPQGATVFRQVEPSDRFNDKTLYAVIDVGSKDHIVASDLIRRSSVELKPVARPGASLRRADYFIIED